MIVIKKVCSNISLQGCNNMKKNFLIASLAILFKTYSAIAAGGWTSGGGELIRDQHNPWFIQNTTQVNYCILINEAEFGQNKDFVRNKIEKSILFWKTNLKDLKPYSIGENSSIVVGTQTFQEVSCDESHNLTFQFGVLTDEQKRRMGDTSKIIGVTIRTDYDVKQLQAKGFIYLPKDSQFPSHPWSSDEGMRVLPVLIHEMGHVFGLQHGSQVQYMYEEFPASLIDSKGDLSLNWILRDLNQDDLAKTHIFRYEAPVGNFFVGSCGATDTLKDGPKHPYKQNLLFRKFFALKDSDNCSHYLIDKNKLNIYAGKNEFDLIGQATLVRVEPASIQVAALQFWMPKEQVVFSSISDRYLDTRISMGLYKNDVTFKGEYKSLDGKVKRKIALKVTNWGMIETMSGVLDNEIYVNILSGY